MQEQTSQYGYTLIDLFLVAVVCGIVASIAIPTYAEYRTSQRFAEVTEAVDSARIAIERAVAAGQVQSVTEFDSGTYGIPGATGPSPSSHGLAVVDGAITVTWRDDGSALAGETYTLTVNGHLPPVQWTVSGSCLQSGFC